MYYTGIGSRDTPKKYLRYMELAATYLAENGLILRSGGADGADTAFEKGCDFVNGKKEIFLPWQNFNNNKSNHFITSLAAFSVPLKLAEKYHPAWNKLTEPSKKLMARNTLQVLGPNLCQYSSFILCYTSKGDTKGGTGQAIRIANNYGIPVLNFGKMSLEEIELNIEKFIREYKNEK